MDVEDLVRYRYIEDALEDRMKDIIVKTGGVEDTVKTDGVEDTVKTDGVEDTVKTEKIKELLLVYC